MFLYSKEQAISSEVCKAFISNFEISEERKPGVLYNSKGFTSEDGKKSTDISFTPEYLSHPTWGTLLSEVVTILDREKHNYEFRHKTAFSTLGISKLDAVFNMQRYLPGEGFFNWHCERGGLGCTERLLVWMIYLNTVTDRGETEFYYQHHFEPAVEGKLIICPSDWTYLHRGVSSLTQTKYILTGWYSHFNGN